MSDTKNAVIVALPEQDDRVNKLSSEEKAHMTLLFLGEADKIENLQAIMEFVQHAVDVSEHGPFMLDVDRRGTLGPDEADVLFFRKGWDIKWVNFFRSQLLQNTHIRTAYDSVEQYPEWTPHLTMGYPTAPAKEDDNDYRISWVSFDRIAVWTGDFEGPEFRLTYPERDLTTEGGMAMSDLNETGQAAVADILGLEHHGVKGMKWGVRKLDDGSGGEIRINNKTGMASPSESTTIALVGTAVFATPALPVLWLNKRFRAELNATRAHNKQQIQNQKDAKDLSKFEKRVKSAEGFRAIHNGSVDQFNREIGKLNSKPEYAGDLNKNPAAKKAYDAEALKLMQDAYRASANSLMNKKLTHHVDLEFVNDGMDFKVHVKEGMGKPMVEHAATEGDTETFTGKIKRTVSGHIFSLEFDDFDAGDVEHTAELGAEFMEHHGVKGMRWGVRKDDVSGAVEKSKVAGRAVGRATGAIVTAIGDASFEDLDRVVEKTDQGVEITKRDKVEEHISSEASLAFNRTDLPKIKAKPEYQAAKKLRHRLLHPKDPATKAYRQESKEAYIKRLEEVANSMENFSGTRQYTIRERGWEQPSQGGDLPRYSGIWEVSSREIKHGVAVNKVIPVQVDLDEDGFITKITPGATTLAHSDAEELVNLGMEFLAHHGVKGMKWGVRKDRFQSKLHERRVTAEEATRAKRPVQEVRAYPTIGKSKRKKASIETKGGFDHRPTDDAINVAVAKQKLTKSGVHTLSNAELQEVQRRLNLENDVKRLMEGDKSKGKKFVDGILGRGDKNDKKQFEYQLGQEARKSGVPLARKAAPVAGRAARKVVLGV